MKKFSPLKNKRTPAWIKSLALHVTDFPVTGFILDRDTIVTFRTENDTFVVADLKSRQFVSVETGEKTAFPENLKLCIIDPLEFDTENNVFHAGSNSATTIVNFARANFAYRHKTSPIIPEAEMVEVKLKNGDTYVVALTDVCDIDRGNFKLEIRQTELIIRCNGKTCKQKGKRWVKPSHSASGKWDLSFLFAPSAAAADQEPDAKKVKKNKEDANGYPPPPPGWGYMLVKLQ